jgi:hypothetical protein
MPEAYFLHGKHVSEEVFTNTVLDVLLSLSRKHPGNIFFGQQTIKRVMFYDRREKEGENFSYSEAAYPQQIRLVLDKEAMKGDKERRIIVASTPFNYDDDNFKGSRPPVMANHYRSRFEYIVDLRKIEGEGEFPCPNPSCGKLIEPDDTESNKVVETVYKGKKQEDGIEAIIVSCNNCQSKTEIIGLK